MTSAKLALKNLKKSFKDYAIYFLTIAFGVCLFYVFNSIDSQESMIKLSNDARAYFRLLTVMINGISVFVAIVLAFLVIYANKFLIKRRKKELSVYMLLGMEKSKISSILVFETFFTGIIAMAVGLVVGIFASQGLSVIIANMFKASIEKFSFTFSAKSLMKTILYFGLIFVVVMVFNVINITRCKLITLISSDKKNEVGKIKSFTLSLILFILSIACIVFAYHKILKNGFMSLDLDFKLAIAFGTVGTLLFFMSVSGFLLQIIKKSKKLYYKNLNMFTLRQFSNKINTNCISMTIISIMLLLTIGVLACAVSINQAMNLNLEKCNRQDAMFYSGRYIDFTGNKITLQKQKICTKEFSEYSETKSIVKDSAFVNCYVSNYYFEDLVGKINEENYFAQLPIEYITLTDYNNAMKLQGGKALNLADDEYAIICNSNENKKYINEENLSDLNFKGKKLKYNNGGLIDVQIYNSSNPEMYCTLVVNDKYADKSMLEGTYYLMNFKNGDKDYNKFKEITGNKEYANKGSDLSETYVMSCSKKDSADLSAGMSVLATFLSLYIGVVFLITSCAVLALQQLSESTDNKFRYKLLRKIGASSKSLSQALFRQIGIYFALPLLVAICHSVIGIKAIVPTIKILGEFNIFVPALITAGVLILVYGGYFLITYYSSKNIIKK